MTKDCKVYYYIHDFVSRQEGDISQNSREKLSSQEQKDISGKILEYAFFDFFGEKFLWDKVLREEGGKPVYAVEGHFFNISHCSHGIAAALSKVPVGVDIGGSRRVKTLTVKKSMDDEEKAYIGPMEGEWLKEEQMRRFFHLWTLKESYVKMTGQGIRMPLTQICFSLEDGQVLDGTGDRRILYAKNRVLKPWGRESVSCVFPVPGFSLAITLGWDWDKKPEILFDKVINV